MTELLLALPAKKARKWTQKTVSYMAAFYLTDEEKESMPSGAFSSPIVASDIYVPTPGDTWVYQGYLLVAIHRHSGSFKKFSRGVRVPPIVVWALEPQRTGTKEFQAFLLKVIDDSGRVE